MSAIPHYSIVHANRLNLLIHLIAVPLFVLTMLILIFALASGRFALAGLLAAGPIISLAAQGLGHRLEVNAPEPFGGSVDFLRRVFLEQFHTFPFFVLTGGWIRAWKLAERESR